MHSTCFSPHESVIFVMLDTVCLTPSLVIRFAGNDELADPIKSVICMLLQAFGGGYYRGGFEPKMNKREAALVLGVRYVKTFIYR